MGLSADARVRCCARVALPHPCPCPCPAPWLQGDRKRGHRHRSRATTFSCHHRPWTSGSIGVRPDLTTKWSTGGGWGNMRIHQLGADGTPIEGSCTRNGGKPCDPTKLDHGR